MADMVLKAKITGDSNELKKAVDGAKSAVSSLNDGIKKSGAVSKESSALTSVSFTQAGQTLSNAGSKILGSYKSMVTGALDFESATRRAGVLTGGSYDSIKNAVLSMAKSSVYTTTEVANAMANLGQKGFDAKKSIAAMPGVLSAAAASGEDLGLVSDTITSALNAFGKEASESSKVADVLATAANMSAAGIGDMSYAFKYAAPMAKTLGFSIYDLSASTAILADVGIKGEQAGTSLRAGFTRLSNPVGAAEKALKKLGISLVDSGGNMKPLQEIIRSFSQATKDMGGAQKTAALSTIFGSEAQGAWGNLIDAGPEKLKALTMSLEGSSGASNTAAESMLSGWGGSMKKMSSAIDVLQKRVADAVAPIVGYIANMVSGIVEWFDTLPAPVQNVIGIIGALVGAIMSIGGAILSFVAVKAVLDTLGLGAKFMSIGMQIGSAMTLASLPIIAIVAAIALIGYAIYELWNTSDGFRSAVMSIWDSISANLKSAWDGFIKPVFDAIVEVVKSVIDSAIKPLYEKFKVAVEIIVVAVASLMKGLRPVFDWLFKVLGVIIPPLVEAVGRSFKVAFAVVGAVVGAAIDIVSGAIKNVTNVLNGIIKFVKGVFTGNWKQAWKGLVDIVSSIWKGIVSIVKMPINWVIDGINFFIKGLNTIKIPDWVPLVGGKGINIPLIPNLLHGTDDWQGGFARMNEGGRGELTYLPNGAVVVPHDISRVYAKESARMHNATDRDHLIGGTIINVSLSDMTINDTRDIKVIAKELATYTAREVRYGY